MKRIPEKAVIGKARGVALIIVLWIVTLLTVIVNNFSFSMRSEVLIARNQVALAQARSIADGAIHRAVYELQKPPSALDRWRKNGQSYSWEDGSAQIVVTLLDESGKIDLNLVNDALLRGLIRTVGGLDDQEADRLVDAIADWRDNDDLRRVNGAEEADYRSAGRNYGPANTRFEVVEELQRVLGMSPQLYFRLAPHLTVHTRQQGINPVAASREVLLSIPGLSEEQVDAYLAARQTAIELGLPPPPLAVPQNFLAGDSQVVSIRAQATMQEGIGFIREAVMRMGGNPRRPYAVLRWTEGAEKPLPVGQENYGDHLPK